MAKGPIQIKTNVDTLTKLSDSTKIDLTSFKDFSDEKGISEGHNKFDQTRESEGHMQHTDLKQYPVAVMDHDQSTAFEKSKKKRTNFEEDETSEYKVEEDSENSEIGESELMKNLEFIGDSGKIKCKTFAGIPEGWHKTIRIKNPDT